MSVTVILGLRRSGTTIFWNYFRQDARFTCFDEPFSEQLMRLPQEHRKGVFSEYRALVERAPSRLLELLCAGPQGRGTGRLLHPAATRVPAVPCWSGRGRCPRPHALPLEGTPARELLPDARFLHLIRSERAFASSHLLPSRTDPRGRLRHLMLQRSFWTRSDRYDFWGMETLCGTGPGSKLSLLLDDAGFDVPAFYALPAVGRLIVLHRYLTCSAEAALASTGRSASVTFEDFAREPSRTVDRACSLVGARPPPPVR